MLKNYSDRRQVKNRYKELEDGDIEWFFDSFSEFLPGSPHSKSAWDILIAYLFIKVEQAHRMALYAVMIKKHRINTKLATEIAGNSHLSRESFLKQYKKLTGETLCKDAAKYYIPSAKIRGNVMHGKGIVHGRGILFANKVSNQEKKSAVVWILEYAVLFNKQFQSFFVDKKTKELPNFKPFGRMRGFAGEDLDNYKKSKETLEKLGISLEKPNKKEKQKNAQ